LPEWFPLYHTVEAFGSLGCSVPPWELVKRPECWGVWAIDYVAAKREATAMRAEIEAARAKGEQ
jgi:hypothetical protein